MRKEKTQEQGAQTASAAVLPCTRTIEAQTASAAATGIAHPTQMACAEALPAEWVQYMQRTRANNIYFTYNNVKNNTCGQVNICTDPQTAEQIAQMASEIALLREQVQTLCGIIREYINK